MGLQDELIPIFQNWGSNLNSAEKKALRKKTTGYSINDWKAEHISMAVASGAASGAVGGPVGLAAIIPDLVWCKKVGTQGCLGMGYILKHDVDYEQDMNGIMAIWTDIAEATVTVPAGKVGIKVSNKVTAKMAGKVAGKVVSKAAFKGGSKVGMKLITKVASKGAAKVATKLVAKTSFGWIPLVGGAVSGGINWWLLNELLDAAEEYYTYPYAVLKDKEIASAA